MTAEHYLELARLDSEAATGSRSVLVQGPNAVHVLDLLAELPGQWEAKALDLRAEAERYADHGMYKSSELAKCSAVVTEQLAADLRRVLGIPREETAPTLSEPDLALNGRNPAEVAQTGPTP